MYHIEDASLLDYNITVIKFRNKNNPGEYVYISHIWSTNELYWYGN